MPVLSQASTAESAHASSPQRRMAADAKIQMATKETTVRMIPEEVFISVDSSRDRASAAHTFPVLEGAQTCALLTVQNEHQGRCGSGEVLNGLKDFGGRGQIELPTRGFSPLLYQLSYPAEGRVWAQGPGVSKRDGTRRYEMRIRVISALRRSRRRRRRRPEETLPAAPKIFPRVRLHHVQVLLVDEPLLRKPCVPGLLQHLLEHFLPLRTGTAARLGLQLFAVFRH